eukprot:4886573-Amphidinium_carterae.1
MFSLLCFCGIFWSDCFLFGTVRIWIESSALAAKLVLNAKKLNHDDAKPERHSSIVLAHLRAFVPLLAVACKQLPAVHMFLQQRRTNIMDNPQMLRGGSDNSGR